MRGISALYRTRALAEAAIARLEAAGVQASEITIAGEVQAAGSQAGMFDRLATMLAREHAAPNGGFTVATQVAADRIDSIAIALEAGAERIEIASPPRLVEQVVELSQSAEELVIEKQAFVREEIVMHTQAREHTQDVHETVRHMEAEIERFGPTGE